MKKTLAGRAYLIALHLALLAVVFKPYGVAGVIQRFAYGDPSGDGIERMRLVHHQMDDSVPPGATVFLGDSITMGLATAAVAPLSVNYGIGWQRSDQLLQSMDIYRSMARAHAVVLTIGTNDVLQDRTEGLRERYRAILAKIPAGVPVIMSSIPPQRPHDVRPVVRIERETCAQDPRCSFVDAFSVLAKTTGALLPDGVHLTPVGYAAWIATLKQELAHHQTEIP